MILKYKGNFTKAETSPLLHLTPLLHVTMTRDCDYKKTVDNNHMLLQVTHHMGKMKIKANPEGADFDFSGGDLEVDLRPAHSDIVPIYNYFRNDFHDYHVQPVVHHYEEIHHHSGDAEHYDLVSTYFYTVTLNNTFCCLTR